MQQITSLKTYWKTIHPRLTQKQSVVYRAFLEGDYSNREVARKLNMDINCVTPRTGELVDAGLLYCVHFQQNPSGRTERVLSINSQSKLF